MSDAPIILASASPRRKDLLTSLGLRFIVDPADVEEELVHEAEPARQALHLAQWKAQHVSARYRRGVVIGADTIVVIDNRVLNKPSGPAEAVTMLATLAGRTHRVITAVAVADADSGRCESAYQTTLVTFRPLSHQQIARYIATGEPFDKAGGYGIQGLGSLLVARIEGCYPNVVGLPLVTLAELLTSFGVDIL